MVRPDDPAAHLQLAGTLALVQRYDETVDPIEAAMRLDPANIPAIRAAAIIYHQARRNQDIVSGHLKVLSYMVGVHLEGLLEQPGDELEAASWAQRERAARRAV